LRRSRAILARVPRPTHPALVAATALVVLAGVAAGLTIALTPWSTTGVCNPTRMGTDSPPCRFFTDAEPAASIGIVPLVLVVCGALAWFAAWLFWCFALWLHHRPGPRGLRGSVPHAPR
jgi:hypothetical protein